MLSCPVCNLILEKYPTCYKCENGHNFDIARKGYVNLLISNSARHGDDKEMSVARRDFLNGGYYQPLLDAICEHVGNTDTVLDIGCGECYYISGIKKKHPDTTAVGVDISKPILETAAPRIRESGIIAAVANSKSLPMPDASVDTALSVFAPISIAELLRVLKKSGKLIRVVPGAYHLIELKRAVYDLPRPNDDLPLTLDGMKIEKKMPLRYQFTLPDTKTVKDLFTMTPYYYKTSLADRAKLDAIPSMTVTADFYIIKYTVC